MKLGIALSLDLRLLCYCLLATFPGLVKKSDKRILSNFLSTISTYSSIRPGVCTAT